MKKHFLFKAGLSLAFVLAGVGAISFAQASIPQEAKADVTFTETKTYIHQIWVQITDNNVNARIHFWLDNTDWSTDGVVQKNLSDLGVNLAANVLVDSTANVISQTLCFAGNAQGNNTANYVAYGTNKDATAWQKATITVNAGAQFPSYAYTKDTTTAATCYVPGATQKFAYSSTDGNGCLVFTQAFDSVTKVDTEVKEIMVQPGVSRCHFLLSDHDYTGVTGWAAVPNASGFNTNSNIQFNGTANLLNNDAHYNTNDTGSIGFANTGTITTTDEATYSALKILIPAGTEFPSYLNGQYNPSAKTEYATPKNRLYTFTKADTANNLYYYNRVSYAVSFVNDDGTVLQKSDVLYGDTAAYTGATPTKTSSVQYDYTFAGWDKTFSEVTEATTYTATYTSAVRSYAITFKNADAIVSSQTVAFGAMPTVPAAIDKAADAEYTYTWAGWADSNGDIYTGNDFEVSGEATYFATWTKVKNKYEITFISEGVTLSDEQIDYGTTPTMPADPTKAPTTDKSYTFDGWYDDATAGNKITDFTVKAKMTYYAHFVEGPRTYAITFKNGDTVVSSQQVAYGELPTIPAAIDKPADAQYTYTWSGWADSNGDILTGNDFKVAGDATYFATWTKALNVYTVTFSGATVASQQVEYGKTVSKPADPTKEGYTFNGWYLADAVYDFATPVTGDITLTARWTAKGASSSQPATSSSSSSTSSKPSSSSSSSSSSSGGTSSDTGNKTGLIVGLSVGGGVLLVGGGVGLFFFLKKKKHI